MVCSDPDSFFKMTDPKLLQRTDHKTHYITVATQSSLGDAETEKALFLVGPSATINSVELVLLI
jgi:hypothetical protein